MTLKEFRTYTKMTQKQFSEYFGISHRTIQNWEGGQRGCPQYLLELMIYKFENEKRLRRLAVAINRIANRDKFVYKLEDIKLQDITLEDIVPQDMMVRVSEIIRKNTSENSEE